MHRTLQTTSSNFIREVYDNYFSNSEETGISDSTKWRGLRRFLDIVQSEEKKRTPIAKQIRRWRNAPNIKDQSEQIARLLLHPASGKILERLAVLPEGSRRSQILAFRLTYMCRSGLTSK